MKKEINDYTERNLLIYAFDEQLCVGEETNLQISSGSNWNNIQWFEEKHRYWKQWFMKKNIFQ